MYGPKFNKLKLNISNNLSTKEVPFVVVGELCVVVTRSVKWVVVMATELIPVVMGDRLLGNIVIVVAVLTGTGTMKITSISSNI